MKFRKKPVVIEAVQWMNDPNSDDLKNIQALMPGAENMLIFAADGTANLEIKTLEGVMTAQEGDWIIKGIKGEFYPCKPDIFEATYELVKEN